MRLCRDNLDEDLGPWAGGGFSFEDFKRMADLHREGPEVQMLQVCIPFSTTKKAGRTRHAATLWPRTSVPCLLLYDLQ